MTRVLVVDDEPQLRRALELNLTARGYEVVEVSSGSDVVNAVVEQRPSIVLLDLGLPGLSGLQVIELLRRWSSIPIIVLTARGGADAAAQGLASGADDYITKPFASQELLARVRANHELHNQRERAIDDAENRVQQVRAALESNRLIGTAIGVLMASHRLTAAQAFQLLTKASQDSNTKLRDLAAVVAGSGKLPFRPTTTESLVIRITSGRP